MCGVWWGRGVVISSRSFVGSRLLFFCTFARILRSLLSIRLFMSFRLLCLLYEQFCFFLFTKWHRSLAPVCVLCCLSFAWPGHPREWAVVWVSSLLFVDTHFRTGTCSHAHLSRSLVLALSLSHTHTCIHTRARTLTCIRAFVINAPIASQRSAHTRAYPLLINERLTRAGSTLVTDQ